MKKTAVLCFVALLFTVLSCNKEENSPPALADKVAGNYHGMTTNGTFEVACTSLIEKTSDKKVRLTISINGSIFIFGEISIAASGNIYTLSYTEPNGSLNGRVEGNTLTYNVNSGVLNTLFTGTR